MNNEEIVKAIKGLQTIQKRQMNHQLACAAVLSALVRTHPDLNQVLEEYEAAIDRLAAEIPPSHQMPEIWQDFETAIRDATRKRPRPQ